MWRWIAFLVLPAPLWASPGSLPRPEHPIIGQHLSTWTGWLSVDVEEKENSIVIDAHSYRLAGTRGGAHWQVPYEYPIQIGDGDSRLGVLLYTNRRFQLTIVGQLVGTREHPRIQVHELKFTFHDSPGTE